MPSSSVPSVDNMPSPTSRRRHNFDWLPPHWDDWSPPDPKAVEEELKNEFTDKQKEDAWKKAAEAVKTHHDELVGQWQKAMDSILTYAGLFSAVLTAFNVQSYQLLQPASTDPTGIITALQQISAQLNSFSINPSFVNSTQPALSQDQLQPPFRAPVSAIWINALWFSSLVCSLASASIALMVKQWLYEESQGLSGTSREAARRRQYRLDSLIKWRVGAIVLVPSVLLQVALFLFLSGLLVLLWTIHHTVAAVVTALTSVLFLFVFATTIIPIFAPDCCYRAPQAYGVFIAMRPVFNGVDSLVQGLSRQCAMVLLSFWLKLCNSTRRYICLERIVFKMYMHCRNWNVGHIPTWKGAEQNEVARDSGLLDRHIATMAYTTTSGVEHLEALHILFSDLPCKQALACFPDIHRFWIHLWGPNDAVRRSGKLADILLGKPFLYALRQVFAIYPDERYRVVGKEWIELFSRPDSLFSSYTTSTQHIHPSAQLYSTLVLISISDSELAKKIIDLLFYNFLYKSIQDSIPASMVTYDVLRNIMALARWNVENWVTPNQEEIERKFHAIHLSLTYTEWVLTRNLSLTGEQEAWIRQETRSLLHSLIIKPEIPATYSVRETVRQVICLCKEVTRGYEMMPHSLLRKTPEHRQPGNHFHDLLNDSSSGFKSLIPEQYTENYEKTCFRTQLPSATVF